MSATAKQNETNVRDSLSQLSGIWSKITSLFQGKHELVWKDNLAPMIGGKGAEMAEPDLVAALGGIYFPQFAPNIIEEAMAFFHINHDIARNSLVYPHIHWSPSDANAGTVRWGFEYAVLQRDVGNTSATTTIYLEDTANGNVGIRNQVVEATEAQAFTAPEVDSLVVARIFRDATHANDTYASDAIGLFGDLHYQAEMSGTPQKAADFYRR